MWSSNDLLTEAAAPLPRERAHFQLLLVAAAPQPQLPAPLACIYSGDDIVYRFIKDIKVVWQICPLAKLACSFMSPHILYKLCSPAYCTWLLRLPLQVASVRPCGRVLRQLHAAYPL
jgi:hypothetical protein